MGFREFLRVGCFALAFFCVCPSGVVMAAPGDLDATFGASGKVITTDFRPDPSASSAAYAVAIQPDGKIVVTGTTGELAGVFYNYYLILARYNADGSLDASFGSGGRVTSNLGSIQVVVNAIALQPDGKILVGGQSPLGGPPDQNVGLNFFLARFNNNGSVDANFGNGGFTATDFSGGTTNDDGINSIVVQPDGKIAVAGYSRQGSSRDFAMARYNPDGSPDNSFDNDGKLVTAFSGNDDEAYALLLQTDGKLIAAGYGSVPGFDFALARYNPNGSLDTGFDGDGKATLDFGGSTDQGRAAVLEPNGKIVVAGNARLAGAQPDMAIARFNTDGSPDTTFDADGKNTIDFSGLGDAAYAMVRQVNGKYVTGGYATVSASSAERDFGLARFNANGAVDTTFGTGGKTTTRFSTFIGDDFIRGLALQADGKIVAAGGGITQANGSTRLALARYIGDAPLAPVNRLFDFDGDGRADIGVFRQGNWYLLNSSTGFTGVQFGISTDKLVPADYDGDGKTDFGVYRDGVWYLLRSSAGFTGVQFGTAEDIPQTGDFDGDRKADFAVFRPADGTWYLQRSADGFTGVQFGANGDKPVAADYDGDGKADVAVYRAGVWYVLQSRDGFRAVQFGIASDKPVVGDYDGDARADFAVYRAGVWYLQQSTAGFTGVQFGIAADVPAPADYDGDGKTDLAVFRDGTWYLQQSVSGFAGVQFGVASDVPVESAYVP
ncbi:MAG TPA: FG-GAP-like repeat-containing protein [Pyrinomonadaceae bacterium]|jgi:uncharacterized delta-60 repeat protein